MDEFEKFCSFNLSAAPKDGFDLSITGILTNDGFLFSSYFLSKSSSSNAKGSFSFFSSSFGGGGLCL